MSAGAPLRRCGRRRAPRVGRVFAGAVLAALAGTSLPLLAADEFALYFRLAAEQAATVEGSAYDQRLGEVVTSDPDYEQGMLACYLANPGSHRIEGYYRFGEQRGEFRVVFRSRDGFSRCVRSLLEGQSIPEPPFRPYFNPVTITYLGEAV